MGLEKCTEERITKKLYRLGSSYDWSRVAFTMNPQLSTAVVETFCRLHEKGLYTAPNRLVNWCTRLNTTLSNESYPAPQYARIHGSVREGYQEEYDRARKRTCRERRCDASLALLLDAHVMYRMGRVSRKCEINARGYDT